jgi:hypothetical protein
VGVELIIIGNYNWKEKMNTKIRISGNIISELSEKIPTHIIALNELIKNSYDAGASSVTVELNTREKTLLIKDNGSGMGKKDIDTLFLIAKSNKIHGKKNEYGRITQGSKGLGFLSVFKFGKFVEWKTNKNKGYSFSADFNDLIGATDLSHFSIDLFEDSSIQKGTEIIIHMDQYSVKSLNDYLSMEKNYRKIINFFDDDNFFINLKINKKEYSAVNKIPLLDNDKKQQLFYVTYNCKTQEIIFRHNDHIILTESFPFRYSQFNLNIELLIFQLKSHGKEKIDKLFFNPNDDLTPLIYFNSNFFNNFNIFDPNIMRNIKTSQVLNQMIGFIRIISKNKKIDFNSDRSQFLQNELTDNIKVFLADINRKIQELGSKMKDHLIKFDFLTENKITPTYFDSKEPEEYRKLIDDNFFFKDKVDITVQADKIIYSLFGKKTILSANDSVLDITKKGNKKVNKKTLIPPKINLNCASELKFIVPSDPLNLKDYIASVYDSDGELVDIEKIKIKIDGEENTTGILPSIETRCEKTIEYHYSDSKAGPAIKKMRFVFLEPKSNIITKKIDDILIYIPAGQHYKIKYNQFMDRLIEQINSLKKKEYFEMISCSLRPIFELSITSINQSKKYSGKFNRSLELADKVAEIVSYIKSNQNYIREIDKSTTIGFHNLNNMLNIDEFKKAVKNTNLGSHQASVYLTEQEMEHIAKYASLFIVIINEMLNNKDIK